ncbi:MipA/OmpV family protein [Sphingomonas sp. CJ20]
MTLTRLSLAALALLASAGTAHAQSDSDKGPRRTRVSLGPQLSPNFPGSDKVSLSPLVDVVTARAGQQFEFEAADESFTIPIIDTPRFSFGPTANLQSSRRRSETGPGINEVGTTLELGAFANVWLATPVRVHAELRKGVNGHGGMIANVGLDYVTRDRDRWLFAIGPRVTLTDSKYQDAYFGVSARESAATGLPVYDPGSGVQAVGANATATYQLNARWGLYGFAKYDRMVGDAADSPITRRIGSPNQFSGGLGLSYTFGRLSR